MKTLGALLLASGVALSSAAEHPRITDLTMQAITWSNTEVNVYCGVEMNWDLCSGVWHPFIHWNLWTTSQITRAHFLLDGIDWEAVSEYYGTRLPPAFFRVVTTTNRIEMPTWTNAVTLCNAGPSVVSNIVVGVLVGSQTTQNVAITQLDPGGCSDALSFTQPADWFVDIGSLMQLQATYFTGGISTNEQVVPTVLPFRWEIGK